MLTQRHLVLTATASVIMPAVGGYALVIAGLVSPEWMGNVAALGFCLGLGLLIAAPFVPTVDREPDSIVRGLRASKLWTSAVLIATVFWELPFVAMSHGPIRGATAQDHTVWLWWLYGVADSGYLNAHPVNVSFEASMVVLVPLEVFALLALSRGNRALAGVLTIAVASCQFYAVSLYYAISVLNGFQYISTDPADIVLKFIGLNSFWVIGPAVQIWAWSRYFLQRQTPEPNPSTAEESSAAHATH